ncbi:OmpH family outer membrane protein [Psychroflexus sp. YR1-1]|uniref:OmpH family outer membrane protein n=1 Tax=Psychroflexus aurantiacus TaxID=2709310 RepID=A0A6B3R219_9FLAO|nr:OmpH family outer membrane protein [Psychroflexus aurantiacus]NEV94696.1 OmpH family outer membrane protein [Psychroflexus aurantiacus]
MNMNTQEHCIDKPASKQTPTATSESFIRRRNPLNSIAAAVLLTSLLWSCNTSNKDSNTSSEDIQREMEDVIQVSKAYTAEKWDNLSDNIEKMEKDIEASTNDVIENYNTLSADLQNQFEDEKQNIADRKAELNKKLEDYKKATGEKKEELKSEIIQLKTALNRSISTFEKEMEEEQN